MRVAFRTDAALEIGTGHVMRCLTLADALRERGAECTFMSRPQPGDMLQAIRERGHTTLTLAPPQPQGRDEDPSRGAYAAWLGASWQADAQETVAALSGMSADALVVDHYAIDRRWEQSVRRSVPRIAVIDDLADRPHDCDLLVDQNPGRRGEDYAALVPAGCRVFAGPPFALLRPQFAARRAASLARRRADAAGLRKLLVAMGGVDKDNVTGRILDVLAGCNFAQPLSVTVLLGAQAPFLPQVQAQARTLPWPTEVLAGVSDVAALMADCDLSIGAGGGTALERCCLGLPALLVVIAENQRPGAEALERAGAALIVDGERLATELPARLAQASRPGVLQGMSDAAAALTDGTGAQKIARGMLDAGR